MCSDDVDAIRLNARHIRIPDTPANIFKVSIIAIGFSVCTGLIKEPFEFVLNKLKVDNKPDEISDSLDPGVDGLYFEFRAMTKFSILRI